MVSNKGFAMAFLVLFGVMLAYSGFNNDAIAAKIAAGGGSGLLVYALFRLDYLLLGVGVFMVGRGQALWKKLLASLCLVYALDITQYPRLLKAAMTTDLGFLANSDAIIVQWALNTGLPYNVVWHLYYIVLPAVLVLISARLLGLVSFGRILKK